MLRLIVNSCMWYPFDTNSEIAGFIDFDWAGNAEDRKSTVKVTLYWKLHGCLAQQDAKLNLTIYS